MSYVDTVDYQARKFGATGTVSVFVVAIAGFFVNLSMPQLPVKQPREQALEVYPVPGAQDKQSTLKVFDVPDPVKPEPKPDPVQPEPQPKPPAEPQKASNQAEVDKTAPDPSQEATISKLDMPTFWTPPPPRVDYKEQVERKEIKKVELPKLVVNDDRAEKKIDVNKPPRLVQAREQRMDDTEVLGAVRTLQRQLGASGRPGPLQGQPRQTVYDDKVIQDGTVALRFQVSATGAISGCTVAVSSGSAILDRRACELVSTFVYEPGTDEKGGKIEKTMIETIEWLGGDAQRTSGTVTPAAGVRDRVQAPNPASRR